MLFAIEILLFGMGLYAAITAKLPSWFVGKGFIAEGNPVRLLGVLMITPLPVAFCAGFTLAIIDSELVKFAAILEGFLVFAAALIVALSLKNIRKPITPSQGMEQNIQE